MPPRLKFKLLSKGQFPGKLFILQYYDIFGSKCEHFSKYPCHQVWIFLTLSLAPSVNILYDIFGIFCICLCISTIWSSFYDTSWSKWYFLYMCEASPGSPHRSQLNNPCPASDVQPVAAPIMRNTKFPSREIEKQLMVWETI